MPGPFKPFATGSSVSAGNVPVYRDANQNAFANNFVSKATNVTSAGSTTVLTAASARFTNLTGSLAQSFTLPDATTLSVGSSWYFNNNSTGILTVTDKGGSTVGTVLPLSCALVVAIAVSTSNGAWDIHFWLPSTGYVPAVLAVTATSDGTGTGTIPDGAAAATITSSAANKQVVLPAPTPGAFLRIYVGANGFDLKSSAPATVAINGGTGSAVKVAVSANTIVYLSCESATTWKAFKQSIDGTLANLGAAV